MKTLNINNDFNSMLEVVDVPAVKCVHVELTKAFAQYLLDHNRNNRKMSAVRVNMLKRDIAAGKWVLNGQSIVVTEGGDLLDGQHRLTAYLEAGAPEKCVALVYIMSETISAAACKEMNGGMEDRAIHKLQKMGFENVNVLVPLVNQIARWGEGSSNAVRLSVSETLTFINTYKDELEHFTTPGMRSVIKMVKTGGIAGLCYVGHLLGAPKAPLDFAKKVSEMVFSIGSPEQVYAKWIANGYNHERLRAEECFAAAARALLCSLTGETMKHVSTTAAPVRGAIHDYCKAHGINMYPSGILLSAAAKKAAKEQ